MSEYMEYLGPNGQVVWATPKKPLIDSKADSSGTGSGSGSGSDSLSKWNYRNPIPIPVSIHEIPEGAIGFTYTLSGSGGGGGAGGLVCGGGAGGAGEFITGRVVLADLVQKTGASIDDLSIESQLGTIGSGGVGFNLLNYGNAGEGGGESTVIARVSTRSIGAITSSLVLGVAKGGFGGLGGTTFLGFGFGEYGTTYSGDGGMGELVDRDEERSRDGPDRRSTSLNHYGDGGDGGAIGSPGLPGLPGYFSIEFF